MKMFLYEKQKSIFFFLIYREVHYVFLVFYYAAAHGCCSHILKADL